MPRRSTGPFYQVYEVKKDAIQGLLNMNRDLEQSMAFVWQDSHWHDVVWSLVTDLSLARMHGGGWA
jgi:hypothetical protein